MIPLLFSLVACGGGEAGVVRPAEASVLDVESDNLVPLPDGRLIVEIDARLSLLDPRRPADRDHAPGPRIDRLDRADIGDDQGAMGEQALEAAMGRAGGLLADRLAVMLGQFYLALDNTVLLPHLGSATVEGRIDMGEKVLINIKTFIDGHTPPDRVIASLVQ